MLNRQFLSYFIHLTPPPLVISQHIHVTFRDPWLGTILYTYLNICGQGIDVSFIFYALITWFYFYGLKFTIA